MNSVGLKRDRLSHPVDSSPSTSEQHNTTHKLKHSYLTKMFASIKVNVINNDHSNNFEIVEQACSPQGNGSQWNNKGGKLTLSMGDNQGSGMLRFKTEQNKEAFFIAMGVEAPRPWVDIVTGLGDDYTCVQALPDYYDYKSERSRMRGDRQVHQIENIDRRLIRAEFKYSEGPNYELDIIINEKGRY